MKSKEHNRIEYKGSIYKQTCFYIPCPIYHLKYQKSKYFNKRNGVR